MPGFNICGQGIGPSAKIEIRRKHRWVWETLSYGSSGQQFKTEELLVLQKAQRPHFKFEEALMHHDQEQAYFAGKHSWEPISMAWYDTENPNVGQAMWTWLQSVVNFERLCVNPPTQYKGEGVLSMLTGCSATGSDTGRSAGGANVTESWRLCNTWPKECNWGELNYTDTELATVEATLRFDRAVKTA